MCGRQYRRQSGQIKSTKGQVVRSRHKSSDSMHVSLLAAILSAVLNYSTSLSKADVWWLGSQRRRSLGLLRLRDRRAFPAESRLGR